MSLVTDCADLARVEQALGIIQQQKAMMLSRALEDMSDLHRALCGQRMVGSPTWLACSEAADAIRKTVNDFAGDAIGDLEQRKSDLIERIQDECERRGLDDWSARNALANAAVHRAAIRSAIKRARTLTDWTRDDLLNNNTSPLYGFRSDWNAYRDWMRGAFENRKRRAA